MEITVIISGLLTKEGALAAYGGLASTNTRTLVYNNGFTVGLGNNVYLYKLVPVVEHSYGGWEVVKEATCTEAGREDTEMYEM